MNARDVLYYGQDFVLRNLKDFPADHWETPNVCGVWSSKLILAHLASFEQLLCEVLHSFVGDAPTPYLNQMASLGGQGFNDFHTNIRRDRPASEVLDELNQASARALELVEQIPAETLRRPGSLPWYGSGYALDDFICYQYYGHKREHSAQINVFKDFVRGVHPPLSA